MTEIPAPAGSESVAARFEARWALLMSVVIFMLLAMIVFTGLHWASMPPSRVEVIDASTLHLQGEFIEDNLGTTVDSNGAATVHLLAEQYAFRPHCLVLPEGEPVTFRATSSDVVHGMQIMGTNVNTMLVPGYISTFVATLRGAGEHSIPCHEFCGVGHASMWARVQVLPKAAFERLAASGRRLSCG
jgi:cytochrome c oxidase subunit II